MDCSLPGASPRSFATTQLWLRWSAGPSSSSVAGTQRPRSGRDLSEKCQSAVDQPTTYSVPRARHE